MDSKHRRARKCEQQTKFIFIIIALCFKKEVKIDDENIYELSKWTLCPIKYHVKNKAYVLDVIKFLFLSQQLTIYELIDAQKCMIHVLCKL